MKIVTIHSDYLEVEPISKAIAKPEEVEKVKKRIEECLVVFTASEKKDEENVDGIVNNTVKEIENVAGMTNAKQIVLYPWVHLTSDPSRAELALEIMKKEEKILKEKGYEVYRAPFGWYKSFSIKCKGHPLSELSREITAEAQKEEGMIKGEKFHKFIVVDTEGKTYEISRDNWEKCELWKKGGIYNHLKIFVRNEVAKNPPKPMPKHIEYMRRMELLDYCPESDVGHMKWYPDGMLLFDLIMDYAFFNIALPWGAFKMKNPLIYRDDVAEIGKLMGEFHERDYWAIGGNKRFVLRFASDPGGFPFVQKVRFSYKQMPVKVYEEAICFRREQAGEVVGLRRMRNFHMTDMHAFCKDVPQAKEEFEKLCLWFGKLMNQTIAENTWVLGWEGTEDFFNENKEYLINIGKQMKVPAFFKLMKEMSHYYAIKNEYQVIGADEANVQVSTVQWDIKDGERFDIGFADDDGKRKPVPVIIHASSFGSIERTLYGILENAARDEMEGKAPMFPLWLSPNQVRLCPVSDKHIDAAKKIAEKIASEKIRVDIDDRNESLGYKIRGAERDWVPYIVVIGDKEMQAIPKGEKIPIRVRKTKTTKDISIDEMVKEIKEMTKRMPFRPRYVPMLLSMRPKFVSWE